MDMARKWRGTSGSGRHLYGSRRNKESSRYSASITVRGKTVHLGSYDTELEAHLVAVSAKEEALAELAKGGE